MVVILDDIFGFWVFVINLFPVPLIIFQTPCFTFWQFKSKQLWKYQSMAAIFDAVLNCWYLWVAETSCKNQLVTRLCWTFGLYELILLGYFINVPGRLDFYCPKVIRTSFVDTIYLCGVNLSRETKKYMDAFTYCFVSWKAMHSFIV